MLPDLDGHGRVRHVPPSRGALFRGEVNGPRAQSPGRVQLGRAGIAVEPSSVDPGVGYHFDVAPGPASEIGNGGDFSLLQESHERGPKVLVDLGLNSIGY